MPGFIIADFGGMSTALSPKTLKANIATYAKNCEVGDGRLKPLKTTTAVSPNPLTTSAQSIYEYTTGSWFEFGMDVDVARVPNAFDVTNKVVYTGYAYPRITRNDIAVGASPMPVASYRLGLPAPTAAPTLSVGGTIVVDSLDDYRSYLYTWVDAWGEESTISPLSTSVNVRDGQNVTVTFPTAPSGAYNLGTGSFKRLYRSNSGTAATAFQFVADVPIGTTTYLDTIATAGLGEVVPTVTWVRPPDDDASDFPSGQMLGATTLPSGAIVGFSGKTLVYSEPYIPYAFPLNYRYTLKDDIVGISPNSQGLVVATTGKPHLAVGHDPASVSILELDEYQSCVSKRSVVDMGESTIYASPDGLVLVSGNTVSVVTEAIFTREQWQALNPSQIHAYRYEGKYVGFTNTQGFVFDPESTEQAWVFTDVSAACGFYSAKEDALYVANGSVLHKWATGSELTYSWKSKTFESPIPMNLGAISVACVGAVSVKIYGDNVLRSTTACTNDTLVRLPGGYTASEWRVELEGTAHVDYVKLATSVGELAKVV
jgi:hypothetical protein